MLKSLCRFLSFLCLTAAVCAGTLDSIRSVSTSHLVITSFSAAWAELLPASMAMAETGFAHYIHPEAWRWVSGLLSGIPAFAFLLGLALLFWIAGYRKQKTQGRFAA
jgi:hypothetical protein